MPSHVHDPGRMANARRVLATVFDPDPRGWAMFAGLSGRLQRGMSGVDGTIYRPMPGVGVTAFHGDAQDSPQQFVGQAGLGVGLGGGRPYRGTRGTTDLLNEPSTLLTDGPMRIWAERMKRTSGSGSSSVSAAVDTTAGPGVRG